MNRLVNLLWGGEIRKLRSAVRRLYRNDPPPASQLQELLRREFEEPFKARLERETLFVQHHKEVAGASEG